MNPAAWGVEEGYWDAAGQWCEPPPASIEAILQAMGDGSGDRVPPLGPHLWFVRAGRVEFLHGPADLTLEDGTTVRAVEALPPDLPPGYHDLHPLDGGPTTRLVVTPERCHLPPGLRTWGWALQLYAARSRASWGIGDLGDLRRLGEWAAGLGAGVLTVNPLHAAGNPPLQPSPYYPSSRRFRNPLYLRIEDLPGAGDLHDLDDLAAAGRALNADRRIDRGRVWALKGPALERLFARFGGDPAFDAWRRAEGAALDAFATYCAIADEHGNGWRSWPAELQHPGAPGVAAVAAERADRVRFHAWLQWQLDRQLEAASSLPVIHDLAVGFDPGGADAWAWQDLLALDARVGAPPDEFNTQGQDWGLPPFVPWRLRSAYYQPFVETLRASLRHAGGLRVDHVMGLFRLFWIPPGGGPRDGTYVRYPASDLLDIVALESHRAKAFVVGEDLGTVQDEVRAELAERRILSYRLLWFEPGPPEAWPDQALAAVTTHDLPTVAGLWTGADLRHQREAGTVPNEAGEADVRRRLRDAAGVDDAAPVAEVTVGAYRALARAPCQVLVATLDDALGVEERPNLPGTVDEWPNWSIALPRPLDDVEGDAGVRAVAAALGADRDGRR